MVAATTVAGRQQRRPISCRVLDSVGVSFGSNCESDVIALGQYWDHVAMTLGSVWDHGGVVFGISLGPL